MSEKLRVEISGDAKELQKATKDAVKSLESFEKTAKKSVGAIDKPTNNASRAMGKLGKSTANANPALQEFSRVIQDAPFGIQGVGNNITQLTSQFGYLSKSAGGTKAALKLMLSSLSGPAGVLFAVSTVVSLLTVFGDKLFKTQTKAEKLAEATKKASEELNKFVESQTGANRALLKGQQSAQSELITLGQLRKVVEDTTRSTEDRQKALQELRRLFPDYFKDLSDEKILTGQLSGVYDQLTTSILKRARATAATGLLVKNQEKQIAIEAELLSILKQADELKAKSIKRQQEGIANSVVAGNLQSASNKKAFTEVSEQSKKNKLIQRQIELAKQLSDLQIEGLDLTNIINENGGIDLSKILLPERKAEIEITPILSLSSEGFDNASRQFDTVFNNLSLSAQSGMMKVQETISEYGARVQLALFDLNEGASNIIQNGIANTFSAIGESIGEALANGSNVLDSLGASLLGVLGGVVVQLGQLAIATGVGLLAVETAFKTLGGVGAIAAGVALVALGSAFKSSSSKIGSSFGGGGGGSSRPSSGGGSTSTSSFSGSGGGFGDGRVVFEISGQKLIGVLERTRNRNLALGG